MKCPHCKEEIKITKKQAAKALAQGKKASEKQKEVSRRNVAQMNWDRFSHMWTKERKEEYLNKYPNVS